METARHNARHVARVAAEDRVVAVPQTVDGAAHGCSQ